MSTGFPGSDAQSDFSRARRARLLADIGRRLRREPDDVALMLPFEEVVEALGRTGQHDLGLQVVPLEKIVGSVDRTVDFDRGLRPTSSGSRRSRRPTSESSRARRARAKSCCASEAENPELTAERR